MERRGRVNYRMKFFRESSYLRVDRVAISATSRALLYGMLLLVSKSRLEQRRTQGGTGIFLDPMAA